MAGRTNLVALTQLGNVDDPLLDTDTVNLRYLNAHGGGGGGSAFGSGAAYYPSRAKNASTPPTVNPYIYNLGAVGAFIVIPLTIGAGPGYFAGSVGDGKINGTQYFDSQATSQTYGSAMRVLQSLVANRYLLEVFIFVESLTFQFTMSGSGTPVINQDNLSVTVAPAVNTITNQLLPTDNNAVWQILNYPGTNLNAAGTLDAPVITITNVSGNTWNCAITNGSFYLASYSTVAWTGAVTDLIPFFQCTVDNEGAGFILSSAANNYLWSGAMQTSLALTGPATGGGGGSPAAPDTSIQFNNAGGFGGSANLIWDGTNVVSTGLKLRNTATSPAITLGAQGSTNAYALLLPTSQGSSGQVLMNDGAGNLSFAWPFEFIEAIATTNVATVPPTTGTVVDGYTTAVGDTVLLQNQTNAAQNGLYIVSAAGQTKLQDWAYQSVNATNGTTNAGKTYAKYNASGNELWRLVSTQGGGGSTNPAGSNTQIQFNNNGAFGASSSLTWDGTQVTLPQLKIVDPANANYSASLKVATGTSGPAYTMTLPQGLPSGIATTLAALVSNPSGTLQWDPNYNVNNLQSVLNTNAEASNVDGGTNTITLDDVNGVMNNTVIAPAGVTTPALKLQLNTSGSTAVTIIPSPTTVAYTLTLPVNAGSANQYLTTSGTTGILSWTTGASAGVSSFGLANAARTGAITIAGSTSVTITESPNGTYTFAATAQTTGSILTGLVGGATNTTATLRIGPGIGYTATSGENNSYTLSGLGNSIYSGTAAPTTVAGAIAGDFYYQLSTGSAAWNAVVANYRYDGTNWAQYLLSPISIGQGAPANPLTGTNLNLPLFGQYWQHDATGAGGTTGRMIAMYRRVALTGQASDYVEYAPPSLDTVVNSGGLSTSSVTSARVTLGGLQLSNGAANTVIQNTAIGTDIIYQLAGPQATTALSSKHRFRQQLQSTPIGASGQGFVIDVGTNVKFVRLFAESAQGDSADTTVALQFENPLTLKSPVLGGTTATNGQVASWSSTSNSWVPITITPGTGTVTNVSVSAPLSGAIQFNTQTTTPVLTTVGSPTATQFLNGAGQWATPAGTSTATVNQITSGNAADIVVAPTTANQTSYSIDLADVTVTRTIGAQTNMAITAITVDSKGRVTGIVTSPISGGGGTVFGDFSVSWSISSSAWFNYPTSSTFTTALANAQTSTGQPTYALSGYGASSTGNTAVPTSAAQTLAIPAFTNTLPVTLNLAVTATMNNSDATTSSVTRSAVATYYVPILYAVTANSANPNLSTASSYLRSQFAFGQSVTQTISAATQYFWIGIPNATASVFNITTFAQFPVSVTPDATFTGQTISGQTYNVYGFTSLSNMAQTIQVIS